MVRVGLGLAIPWLGLGLVSYPLVRARLGLAIPWLGLGLGLANPNQAVWTARPAGPALLSLSLSPSLTFTTGGDGAALPTAAGTSSPLQPNPHSTPNPNPIPNPHPQPQP